MQPYSQETSRSLAHICEHHILVLCFFSCFSWTVSLPHTISMSIVYGIPLTNSIYA
uniref:Uncharacterized protein n=1 Tax=Triticum urartu TaxID=4572 RepID=A0A8R7UPS1_TRIUA